MANPVLSKLFPFLTTAATYVGGPLGTAAANALGAALGVGKANPSQDTLAAAYLTASPDQILAAKKQEEDFAIKMKELGFQHAEQMESIFAADRASARAREVALKDKFVPVLAAFIVLSFTLVVIVLIRGWGKIEAAFAGTLVGYLAANAQVVVNYYYGSSAGSASKSAALEALAKGTENNG